MLPTPRYARIAKRESAVEAITPRLVLAKTKEKVNSSVAERSAKKSATAPKIPGSTK
jgi:hypothetical protein